MSRVGKMPVPIPDKVKVEVKGRNVSAEGPKGKLALDMPQMTSAKVEDGKVVVEDDSQGFDDIGSNELSVWRCLGTGMAEGSCKAFRMVSTSGVQCGSCLEGGIREIWYRSDNDATCTDCTDTN